MAPVTHLAYIVFDPLEREDLHVPPDADEEERDEHDQLVRLHVMAVMHAAYHQVAALGITRLCIERDTSGRTGLFLMSVRYEDPDGSRANLHVEITRRVENVLLAHELGQPNALTSPKAQTRTMTRRRF